MSVAIVLSGLEVRLRQAWGVLAGRRTISAPYLSALVEASWDVSGEDEEETVSRLFFRDSLQPLNLDNLEVLGVGDTQDAAWKDADRRLRRIKDEAVGRLAAFDKEYTRWEDQNTGRDRT